MLFSSKHLQKSCFFVVGYMYHYLFCRCNVYSKRQHILFRKQNQILVQEKYLSSLLLKYLDRRLNLHLTCRYNLHIHHTNFVYRDIVGYQYISFYSQGRHMLNKKNTKQTVILVIVRTLCIRHYFVLYKR